MFSPMTKGQRKAAVMVIPLFAVALVGFSSEAIPTFVAIAAFLIGSVFWWKAIFAR